MLVSFTLQPFYSQKTIFYTHLIERCVPEHLENRQISFPQVESSYNALVSYTKRVMSDLGSVRAKIKLILEILMHYIPRQQQQYQLNGSYGTL
jgi:hypothetical protein